jgi:hypothetical protein
MTKTFNFYTSDSDAQAFYIEEPAGRGTGTHWFKFKAGWIQVSACQAPDQDNLELVGQVEARGITNARRHFQKQLRGEVAVLPDF